RPPLRLRAARRQPELPGGAERAHRRAGAAHRRKVAGTRRLGRRLQPHPTLFGGLFDRGERALHGQDVVDRAVLFAAPTAATRVTESPPHAAEPVRLALTGLLRQRQLLPPRLPWAPHP